MKDLKAKLDQAKKDRELAIETADAEIAELEAKIKEAEKPKLRHGDYGLTVGEPWLKIRNQVWWLNEKGQKSPSNLPDNSFVDQRLGNLKDFFDDLQALQKDVTEFDVGDIEIDIEPTGSIHIETGCSDIYVPDHQIDAFILGLRQMQATIKRGGGK